MTEESRLIVLVHGTTLQRAEAILASGPDPNFIEPGGTPYDPAGGFSTYELDTPTPLYASSADYARGKARNFPNEGGPALFIIEVPVEIVDTSRGHPDGSLYYADSGEIRFEYGMGLSELLAIWPSCKKRIIRL